MGIYQITWKDIYSHNLVITYRTYHDINFPSLDTFHGNSLHRTYNWLTLLWFSAFRRTSLLWLVILHVHLSITSLNTLLWDVDERVLQYILSQVRIWLVPSIDVHFFYARSHLRAPQTGHANFSTYFSIIFSLNSPVYNLLYEFCIRIFWCKMCS